MDYPNLTQLSHPPNGSQSRNRLLTVSPSLRQHTKQNRHEKALVAMSAAQAVRASAVIKVENTAPAAPAVPLENTVTVGMSM